MIQNIMRYAALQPFDIPSHLEERREIEVRQDG